MPSSDRRCDVLIGAFNGVAYQQITFNKDKWRFGIFHTLPTFL